MNFQVAETLRAAAAAAAAAAVAAAAERGPRGTPLHMFHIHVGFW